MKKYLLSLMSLCVVLNLSMAAKASAFERWIQCTSVSKQVMGNNNGFWNIYLGALEDHPSGPSREAGFNDDRHHYDGKCVDSDKNIECNFDFTEHVFILGSMRTAGKLFIATSKKYTDSRFKIQGKIVNFYKGSFTEKDDFGGENGRNHLVYCWNLSELYTK